MLVDAWGRTLVPLGSPAEGGNALLPLPPPPPLDEAPDGLQGKRRKGEDGAPGGRRDPGPSTDDIDIDFGRYSETELRKLISRIYEHIPDSRRGQRKAGEGGKGRRRGGK